MTIDNFVEEQGDATSLKVEIARLFEDVNRVSEHCLRGREFASDIAAGYNGTPVPVYSSLTVEHTEESMYD
ncbi:MAG: hypothetical protein V1729_03505 [Candidatus Woesearchaeota archaeon]